MKGCHHKSADTIELFGRRQQMGGIGIDTISLLGIRHPIQNKIGLHKVWGQYYRDGGLIVSDRYTTSNAVHQASKEPEQTRRDFFQWLYDLEYRHMELPVPDLVIYLDVPTQITEQLMRKREECTHTHADIHEQNMEYLRRCRETGLQAAEYYGWTVIKCAKDGVLRTIEDIHEEIYALVGHCLGEEPRRKD